MLIDEVKLKAAQFSPATSSWGEDDVILYHLGIGAGLHPDQPFPATLLYEKDLKVVPTFAVTRVFDLLPRLAELREAPFDPAKLLHGAHELELNGPLPGSGTLTHQMRIADVFDRGTAAQLVVEIISSDQDGRACFTNRFSLLLTDMGGFGGRPAPRPPYRRPARKPDQSSSVPVAPGQAALYRLSGDKNPIHIDPDVAAAAGFSRPPIHGLFSLGLACRTVMDHHLDGDVTRMSGIQATFGGPAFPGETLVVDSWQLEGELIFMVKSAERGTPVISGGAVKITTTR